MSTARSFRCTEAIFETCVEACEPGFVPAMKGSFEMKLESPASYRANPKRKPSRDSFHRTAENRGLRYRLVRYLFVSVDAVRNLSRSLAELFPRERPARLSYCAFLRSRLTAAVVVAWAAEVRAPLPPVGAALPQRSRLAQCIRRAGAAGHPPKTLRVGPGPLLPERFSMGQTPPPL